MKKFVLNVVMSTKNNFILILLLSFALLTFLSIAYSDKMCPKCRGVYPDTDKFGNEVNFCKYCKPPTRLKSIDSKRLVELNAIAVEIGFPTHWSFDVVSGIFPLSKVFGIKTCMAGMQGIGFDDIEKSILLVLPIYFYISPSRWFSFFLGGSAWGGKPQAQGNEISSAGTAMFLISQGEIVSPALFDFFYIKLICGWKKIWWFQKSTSQNVAYIGLGVNMGNRGWYSLNK